MKQLPRFGVALVVSLALSAVAARAIGQGALALLSVTGPRDSLVVTAIVTNLAVVPLIAGFSLGFIGRHSLFALSIVLVVLSVAVTYRALGRSGLPSGWKIIEYCLQLALIYVAARWGAAFASARARHSARPA